MINLDRLLAALRTNVAVRENTKTEILWSLLSVNFSIRKISLSISETNTKISFWYLQNSETLKSKIRDLQHLRIPSREEILMHLERKIGIIHMLCDIQCRFKTVLLLFDINAAALRHCVKRTFEICWRSVAKMSW